MGIVKLADLLNRGKLNIQLLFCETENRIPKAQYQLKNTVLEANVKIELVGDSCGDAFAELLSDSIEAIGFELA